MATLRSEGEGRDPDAVQEQSFHLPSGVGVRPAGEGSQLATSLKQPCRTPDAIAPVARNEF